MTNTKRAELLHKERKLEKATGIVVPLGALRTNDSPVIGEYPSLKLLIDFCKKSGLKVLQLLPVNDTAMQSSPYSSVSAFALHPIYISITELPEYQKACEKDAALKADYEAFIEKHKSDSRYDYEIILNEKMSLLKRIYTYAGQSTKQTSFIKENPWVVPYAVYKQLKSEHNQASWKEWPSKYQFLTEDEISERWKTASYRLSHNFYVWTQIRAAEQFSQIAGYAKENKIILKGDLPIMMNEDSCDCWEKKELFDTKNRAGSPPDFENPRGQNWGFPTYNWKIMEKENYTWWHNRILQAAKYYKAFRIDHVLGFFRIWSIPEEENDGSMGHENPCITIKKSLLFSLGFSEERIKWLSEPHLATSIVEDRNALNEVCIKLPNEELWNFKTTIKGQKDIIRLLSRYSEHDRNAILSKWTDRVFIPLNTEDKNNKEELLPYWLHEQTTPWKSLSQEEKDILNKLFSNIHEENEKLWEAQGEKLLTELVNQSDMVACAEDLGVSLNCVPKVLDKKEILGLRVIRWCREWTKEGQPFVDFKDYDKLSITTTSVHDSSTLRQWWNTEKDSVRAFIYKNKATEEDISAESRFSSKEAKFVLRHAAETNSSWFVSPLQDFLYMKDKYYVEDENEERINIPGTVSKFNWTYRLSVTIENLLKDKELIKDIKELVAIHKPTSSATKVK